MKVTFELSDKDLRYFRDCLQRVCEGDRATDEDIVTAGAKRLVREVLDSQAAPEFVRERIARLELFVRMLEDDAWRLEGDDRARVRSALAYFVDPDDLIPDKVPGIGYLDDAIMVELVLQELRHETEAYEDFCAYREGKRRGLDADKLELRRQALQARMRRRRRSERDARASRRRGRSPLSLW